MKKQVYFKATLDGGESKSHPVIFYKIGQNIHKNPDRISTEPCGIGIHLAKTLTTAKGNCYRATEYYIAEAGVILGEDKYKIRCASCNILRRLTDKQVEHILKMETSIRVRELQIAKEQEKLRKMLGNILDNGGLCGKEWLSANIGKVTQEMIDDCKLEIITEKQKFILANKMNKKDMRYVLKGALA